MTRTTDNILAAAAAIEARGERVSVRRVRAELGAGDPSTIARALKTRRESTAATTQAATAAPAIPDNVTRTLTEWAGRLAAELTAATRADLATTSEDYDAILAQVDDLQEQLTAAQAALAAAQHERGAARAERLGGVEHGGAHGPRHADDVEIFEQVRDVADLVPAVFADKRRLVRRNIVERSLHGGDIAQKREVCAHAFCVFFARSDQGRLFAVRRVEQTLRLLLGLLCEGVESGRWLCLTLVDDVLRGAQTAHLTGVERAAARPENAETAGRLADGVKALDGGLPVGVDAHAAVVVLGADGNAQRFFPQVDAVLRIEGDRARVHAI